MKPDAGRNRKAPAGKARARSGRILHVSDVHFGREHVDAVAAMLDYARASPHDLMLVTGDITQTGRQSEFAAAAGWIKAMPGPLFVAVGNHDTPLWGLIDRVLWPWRRFERATGHPAHGHQFRDAGLMVRGVNTARGWQFRLNWSKGAVDLDHARRAAKAFEDAEAGVLRVIACHHPLVETDGTAMTGGVRRGRMAARMFAAAGVDLIVTGHTHRPFALPLDLADGRTYAVGGGTLSHRERGEPPGFNLIEWDADAIVVTVMTWRDGRFSAERAHTLARRRA